MENSAIEQLSIKSMMGSSSETDKIKLYYDKKIEDLIKSNKDQVITDVAYVLSDNSIFIKILERYIKIQRLADRSSHEAFYEFWCSVYELVPKNFHKGMTKELFKQNRTLSLIDTNKTKKRWIKMALEDKSNKFLNKELLDCKRDYLLLEGNIKAKYNVTQPDQLIEFRKSWFKDWLDKDRLMVEFPYLESFTKKKVSKAFELDIYNCISTIIMEEYYCNIDNIQTKRPEDLMRTGIFALTPRTRMEYTPKEVDGQYILVSEIDNGFSDEGLSKATLSFNPQNLQVTDEDLLNNGFLGFIISNTISPDALIKMNNNATIKRKLFSNLTLDQYDIKMLDLIFNRIEAPMVRIYHKEFIKYLDLSRSSYNYEMVEGKLRKLPGYLYSGEFVNSGTTTMNFINSVNTFKDEFGEPYSDIIVGQNLYLSITKGKVMRLYTRELNKLKLHISQTLAYMFVMERNKLISMGEDINDKEYTYSLDFFKQFIYLNKKNSIKKNMDILEESIIELCVNKFILKTNTRGKDYFKIQYVPDTEDKKNIINSTFSYLPEYIK